MPEDPAQWTVRGGEAERQLRGDPGDALRLGRRRGTLALASVAGRDSAHPAGARLEPEGTLLVGELPGRPAAGGPAVIGAVKATHGFEAALRSGQPVLTCEIAAGDSPDPAGLMRRVAVVRDHVDAVNLPDNTAGIAHLSGLAAAALVAGTGVEPILHVTCRDTNRIGLQSLLIGAAALGVRNILCLTGDHVVHGDQPDAKPVFDIDSLGLLRLGGVLRGGRYLSGRPITPPPDLFLGSTENPFAPPFDFRPLRLRKKVEAGARFIQTQIVFNLPRFRTFMERVTDLGID